jgi:hypothetical protein
MERHLGELVAVANYPGALPALTANKEDDTDATSGADLGLSTTVGDHAAHHNAIAEEVNAIGAELGINPSGSFATVLARLNAMTTVRKTADQTLSASQTTLTNATDMAFPVTIGADHMFEFIVAYSAAAITTGFGLAVTCPAFGAGGYIAMFEHISGRAANPAVGGAMALTTVPYHLHGSASAQPVGASEGVAVANAVYIAHLVGICSNPNAAGNIQLQFRSEVAANSTMKKGSFGRMYLN